MTRPRILIITRNLPPLVGGMERLNWHMADELSRYGSVKVIGPRGAREQKPENVDIYESPLKPLFLFLIVAFIKALWTSLRWKPDFILAGSGLTAPVAWLTSKLTGARSGVYLHGFDITVNNRMYRNLWRPTFKKMDRVIVNSSPTKALAAEAGVKEEDIVIVHPGVILPHETQSREVISEFRKNHGLAERKLLLSVGRLTTRKGLREFIELALPHIVKAEPDTILVIVGEAPRHSLGASIQSLESIQDQAEKSGVAEHIMFLGVITDKGRLASVYESADVHIFPVRHIPDDPEGFGMVAIEAAAYGVPTVAFATGGIVDAVEHDRSGYLVDNNDYLGFSECVIKALREPGSRSEIHAFSQGFTWEKFGTGIFAALTGKNPCQEDSQKGFDN